MVLKCASALKGRNILDSAVCHGKRKEGEVQVTANTMGARLLLCCADNSSVLI